MNKVGWELYVAQGLMEFFINKNAQVARRIFDYGLKSHGNNALFLCQYLKFMSFLNEEKNTRSLFETILAEKESNREKEEKNEEEAREANKEGKENGNEKEGKLDHPHLIWDLFLEFEHTFGDLQSIRRVEERKREALKLNPPQAFFSDLIKQTRFLDLWPTSSHHMSLVGERMSQQNEKKSVVTSNDPFNNFIRSDDFSKYAKPQLSEWTPFSESSALSSLPLAEGEKLSPLLLEFLKKLPSPFQFQGPFIQVEDLLNVLRDAPLPEEPKEEYNPDILTSSSKRKSPERDEG